MTNDQNLKSLVKEKYGRAALGVGQGAEAASCCGPAEQAQSRSAANAAQSWKRGTAKECEGTE